MAPHSTTSSSSSSASSRKRLTLRGKRSLIVTMERLIARGNTISSAVQHASKLFGTSRTTAYNVLRMREHYLAAEGKSEVPPKRTRTSSFSSSDKERDSTGGSPPRSPANSETSDCGASSSSLSSISPISRDTSRRNSLNSSDLGSPFSAFSVVSSRVSSVSASPSVISTPSPRVFEVPLEEPFFRITTDLWKFRVRLPTVCLEYVTNHA